MPSHYNGRVGIAAMAKKLSNRVNNLCNSSNREVEKPFDGQGSTFDYREFQSKQTASYELEEQNKALKNEI